MPGNKGHIHAAEAQEKRNFIYDLYSSSYALNNAFVRKVPSNIAKHPLVRNGHVRPVVLQPLFKEIDERDFGGACLYSLFWKSIFFKKCKMVDATNRKY